MLLFTMVFIKMDNSRKQARDAKRLVDLNAMVKAIEKYVLENDSYPGETDEGVVLSTDCASEFKEDLVLGGYLPSIPNDPSFYTNGTCNVSGSANGEEFFFYSWDANHCGGISNCISINRLETQWAVNQLLSKYGKMHSATCTDAGTDGLIGSKDDFNFCFKQ